MKQFAIIFSLLLLIINIAKSNNNKEYLNEYIEIGLKKNLELKSGKEGLNAYDARVDQAMSNFLPSVDLNARYTRAGGGRSFMFPLGQMMNPLYEIAGLPQRFQDEEIPFLRSEEQETKISLVQPLFNLAIYHNYKAQSNQFESAKYDFQAKELKTAYAIKEAYYNYAKALQIVEICEASIFLGNETYELTQKLFQAEKAPKMDVLRSELSLSKQKQELEAAENNAKLAANYFNALLNREINASIKYDSLSINDINLSENLQSINSDLTIEEGTKTAWEYRPEMKVMETSLQTANDIKNTVSGSYVPTLALAVDYGVQGENYAVDTKSAYWMISGVFSWNLFSGFGTDAKVQEIKSNISSLEINKIQVKQMITLEVLNSLTTLKNNIEQLKEAFKSYKFAEENYSLNKLSYAEGVSKYIDLLDAENVYKLSRQNYFITYYNILISKASLDTSMGQYK